MTQYSYTYIMTNRTNTVLYTGVTSDLKKRTFEHKNGFGGHFTSKYKVCKLVYYLVFEDIREAITMEKRIKGGSRLKKIRLVEGMNPDWNDLTDGL